MFEPYASNFNFFCVGHFNFKLFFGPRRYLNLQFLQTGTIIEKFNCTHLSNLLSLSSPVPSLRSPELRSHRSPPPPPASRASPSIAPASSTRPPCPRGSDPATAMQHRSPEAASASASPTAAAVEAMAPGVGGVEPAVTLDQVPRWSDPDQRISLLSPTAAGSETPASSFLSFSDPLTGDDAAAGAGGRGASRFPVDYEINSKIYLWRGHPWNLEVDAVVNSTNEVGILSSVVQSSYEMLQSRY